jgi:hypothetical protein
MQWMLSACHALTTHKRHAVESMTAQVCQARDNAQRCGLGAHRNRQVVEDFRAMSPSIGVAILSLTLVIEAIDLHNKTHAAKVDVFMDV